MNPIPPANWAQALAQLQSQFAATLSHAERTAGTRPLPDLGDWFQAFSGPADLTATSAQAPGRAFMANPWPGSVSPVTVGTGHWGVTAIRYQEALAALQQAWLKIGIEAWGRLHDALTTNEAADNLRASYDLWIYYGEQVFSEQAHSQHYAELVSELINAQVALHLECGIGNQPSSDDPQQLRQALAEAHSREASLRSDLKTLRESHDGDNTSSPGPAKKARARPTSSRKKPTKKRSTKQADQADVQKTAPATAQGVRKKAVKKKPRDAKTTPGGPRR
jgi:hypothetical protein